MSRRPWNIVGGLLVASIAASNAWGAVGRTPTSWEVSHAGEAANSIPIWTPPGTAGLTPSLALAYGHRNGGSLSGEGWGVAGLSAITRCRKTWAQDGQARSVQLDLQDRYCLNGNQLKLVSGTYGTNGAEYRTELETFTRIRSYGSAGNGPQYFVVETKDGLVAEYGNTTNSRIESVGTGTARAWLINRKRDRRNNYIDYVYNENTTLGSYQISAINYTGNSTQGVTPPYQVAFVYQTQPANEIESGYLANGLIKDVVRMTNINITHNGSLLRKYNLNYESNLSSSSKSRLSNIVECADANNLDCLPSTNFSYQNGTNNFGNKTDLTGVAGTPLVLDINGDGRTDIAYSSSGSPGSGTWRVRFGGASGFGSEIATGISDTEYQAAIGIDYNADGLGDILVPYSGGTWWVLLGTTSGLAAPSNTNIAASAWGGARALDVNGDGLDDLVYTDGWATVYSRLRVQGATFGAEQVLYSDPNASLTYLTYDSSAYQYQRNPDFDGDGRDDFMFVSAIYDYYTGDFNYYSYAFKSGSNTLSYTGLGEIAPLLMDLNRDGHTDIAYDGYNGYVYYRLSTGTSFTAWQSSPIVGSHNGLAVADWDGDGFDDLMVSTGGGTWSVARSSGEGLTSLTALSATAGTCWYGFTGDINGDGLSEPVCHNGTGTLSSNLHSGVKPDLLATATDGFGNTVTFNYTTLAQGSYYKYSDATFPYQDYQGPLSVVSTANASNGIGGTYGITFTYHGMRLHRQGRGLTPFHARTSVDSRNNVYTYDYRFRNFPKAGMQYQLDVVQPNNITLISRDEFTTTHFTLGAGTEVRFVPYVSQRIRKSYEVGGTYNGNQISQAVTVFVAPDSNSGEIYDSTTTTTEYASGNGVSSGQTWTSRTYVSNLQSDVGNWCLGKPYTVQQINSHSGYGGGSVTRTSGSTWDMVQCRPTQTQVQPGDPNWQVTTVLGYDGFGNVNSQAVTGIGQATRTTTMNWGSTGLFLLSTTNPLGHVTSQTWNPHGTIASATDANGIVTSWLYDTFARKTRENRPDGTYSLFTLGYCAPGDCGWTGGYYSQYEYRYTSGGSYVGYSFVLNDRFGRPVEKASSGLDNGQNTVLYLYNALGQVSQETLPYVCCSNPAYWKQYSYDLLGRQTTESRPISASNATLQTTTKYYEGLTVRTVDPQGKQSKIISNAAGQVRRTVDHTDYFKQFDMDAFGNAIRVTDYHGYTNQSASFNVRGLRTQSVDSDMGTWNYAYNSLGEMSSHTDAKGQSTYYSFNAISQPTGRSEPSPLGGTITSQWQYGNSSAQKNVGKLTLSQVSGGGMTTYWETHLYDSVGRNSHTEYYDGSTYHAYDFGYNSAGHLEAITYPVSTSGYRHVVVNVYSYGHLKYVRDGYYGANYWVANAADGRNNVTDETLANGLRTTRGIDAVTGLPSFIRTGPGGGFSIQNLNYAWDLVGNLTSRNDANQSLTENFVYDNVYRLDYSTLNGTQNLNVDYNSYGNITTKSDVGAYTYAGPRLHAVTNVAGVVYNYDNNGNLTSRGSSTVSYYAHNKPYVLSNGTYTSTFEYGPNGNYWKQVATYSNGTETTKYLGGLLEIVQGPSVTSYRHHIKANGRTVAIYSRGSNGANNTIYPLNDHLGSTDAVTNSSGTIIVKQSFAAFGSRRNGSTWSGAPSGADMSAIGDATRRGYTDHTMLDNIGLVHMNGRVMDPGIGRFVSADPNIDGELHTQGWNRYAYVKNGSLSATDPTGFTGRRRRSQRIDGGPGELDDLETQYYYANFGGGFIRGCMLGNCQGPAAPGSAQYFSFAEQMLNTSLAGFGGASGSLSFGGTMVQIRGDDRVTMTGEEGDQTITVSPGYRNVYVPFVSGPIPQPTQYSAPIFSTFLNQLISDVGQSLHEAVVNPVCDAAQSEDSSLIDAVGLAGDTSDLLAPALVAGGKLVSNSRDLANVGLAVDASAELVAQGGRYLANAGLIGTVLQGSYNVWTGNYASAAFVAADFGVYGSIGTVAAGGAIETGGVSVYWSATAATTYTLSGGSRGLVRGLCGLGVAR